MKPNAKGKPVNDMFLCGSDHVVFLKRGSTRFTTCFVLKCGSTHVLASAFSLKHVCLNEAAPVFGEMPHIFDTRFFLKRGIEQSDETDFVTSDPYVPRPYHVGALRASN